MIQRCVQIAGKWMVITCFNMLKHGQISRGIAIFPPYRSIRGITYNNPRRKHLAFCVPGHKVTNPHAFAIVQGSPATKNWCHLSKSTASTDHLSRITVWITSPRRPDLGIFKATKSDVFHMGVSTFGGTFGSSIFTGSSLINNAFWGTSMAMEHPILTGEGVVFSTEQAKAPGSIPGNIPLLVLECFREQKPLPDMHTLW